MLKSNYRVLIALVFAILCNLKNMDAQHDISKYEIRWAFFHPFAALKVKRHLPEAMNVYRSVKASKVLDTLESGGLLDAFRHSYSMAYLSGFTKSKKLRKLGKAHEKGNKYKFFKEQLEFGERADSLACEMDLRNNELGFLIGDKNKLTTAEELKNTIITAIKQGNAWYLKRNDKNQYVTCDNEPVNFNTYKQKWFLPKCLVKSNE